MGPKSVSDFQGGFDLKLVTRGRAGLGLDLWGGIRLEESFSAGRWIGLGWAVLQRRLHLNELLNRSRIEM